MSYIPNKVMPHASKPKPVPSGEPARETGFSRVTHMLSGRAAQLGLIGAAAAAVLVPLLLARSTARR